MSGFAQTYSQRSAVKASATLRTDPWPAIIIKCEDDLTASKWTIYRKDEKTNQYDYLGEIKAGIDTAFMDEDIDVGDQYTYLIHKESVNKVMGYTLLTAGFETQRKFDYGTCLLIIEKELEADINASLDIYKTDLIREGWRVISHLASNTNDHFEIKKTIKNSYTQSDSTLTAVVLIGNLAVPYSGNMAPDGHTASAPPDHQGAWPADAYYGDLDTVWTDDSVALKNTPARTENTNKRNDGKFDQNIIWNGTELMVGRIFLDGFDEFEPDRVKIYNRYFKRNHEFRTNQYQFEDKAIVNDQFENITEGFAGVGLRHFGQMVGDENVTENTSLLANAIDQKLLWAYGCGGGDYDRCGNRLRDKNGKRVDSFSVSQTSDYFNYNVNCAFNILFGSFFGDWDNDNNLLRAPLAGKSPALATFWAGRPVWHLNEFAHGMPLGQSLLTTQNTDIFLFSDIESAYTYEKMTHIALMGDPTLHLRNIDPFDQSINVSNEMSPNIELSWSGSNEYDGYYVLIKSNHPDSSYKLLNETPIITNSFTTQKLPIDSYLFKIIPIKYYQSPTGSFEVHAQFASGNFSILGDFDNNQNINSKTLSVDIYPNPSHQNLTIKLNKKVRVIEIYSTDGKLIKSINANQKTIHLQTDNFNSGLYTIRVILNHEVITKPFLITHPN
ncbi:MAG: T9SS type A sorting domain-containing protein [Bacteroidia bacterium]